MKKIKLLTLALALVVVYSCSDDDNNASLPQQIELRQALNIAAPQTGGQGQPVGGPFTKFDFATGQVTTSETEWDIAFRGTTIAVNGGAVTGTNDEPTRNGNAGATIVDGSFASVTTTSELSFTQDTQGAFAIPTGSDAGWYNYNFQTNLVRPIPGKVIVLRTRDGRFAKMEILSYYRNNPAQPDPSVDEGRFYTFNYVFNPNAGGTDF